jgi:hypothetical protein
MCNLYSHTRNVEAIRKLFAKFDSGGVNMPPQPGIYPDYAARSCAIKRAAHGWQ